MVDQIPFCSFMEDLIVKILKYLIASNFCIHLTTLKKKGFVNTPKCIAPWIHFIANCPQLPLTVNSICSF